MSESVKKKRSLTLTGLLSLMLLGLIGATAIGGLGRFWWRADLLSHFAVYWAAGSAAVLLLALVLKRWRIAGITAVVLCIHVWSLYPVWLGGTKPVDDALPVLSVTHINILCTNRDKQSAIDFINRCDTDLLIVQEMNGWWEDVLTESDIPYRFEASHRREDSFGIGLLVRESLDDEERLVVESSNLMDYGDGHGSGLWPAIEATVLLDERRVKLLTIHPPPPVSAGFTRLRDDMLRKAKAWADEQADPHVIIGDLNTTPWSYAFDILADDGELVSTQNGFGNQGTWPTRLPAPWLLPIDHCLVSPGLVCTDRRIGEPTGSDHLPLVVTLGLGPEAGSGG